MEKNYRVEGMHCEKCAVRLAAVLKKNGFGNVKIDHVNGALTVRRIMKIDDSRVIDAVEAAGFRAFIAD